MNAPALVALLLALPVVGAAQRLDEEDRKFLGDVHPIILRDEEATFKGLADKADRLEFQKIFWARRDPKSLARYAEAAAPENDFQRQYLKDLAAADDKFHFSYMRGSSTDCGRILILLGTPDEASYAAQDGVVAFWVYHERPGIDLGGPAGRMAIRFDQDCKALGTIAQDLDRIAATRIVHREIGYIVGRDGHLVPLAEQLPREAAARRLLHDPRQDFPAAVQASLLRTDDGRTALLGLLRGVAAPADAVATKAVEVALAASASAEDGTEADRTEQTMKAPVGPDGSFVGSFKLTLPAGRYTLKAGALDVNSGRGSVGTMPVEVPDLARADTAVVLLLRDVEETRGEGGRDTAHAGHPLAAFSLGSTRLVPHFGATLHRTDPLVIFYQAYNLATDANGKADATVTVGVVKGTSALATRRDAITTSVAGSAVGPVPLAGLEPGSYLVRLTLEDRLSDARLVREVPIAIVP